MNKIISLIIISCLFCFSAVAVSATEPSVYVSPVSGSKNVGEEFSLAAGVDAAGTQVCVVMGTLNLDNLLCQSIKVAPGLSVKTAPTCENPNFVLGIPKCATDNRELFAVLIKGNNAGSASANFSDLKVIGAGSVLTNTLSSGSYKITSPVIPVNPPAPQPVQSVPEEVPEEVTEEPEAQVQETAQAGLLEPLENSIPGDAAAASLLDTMKKLFSSPIVIIFSLIIIALLGIWAYNKYYKPQKTN